MSHRKISAVKWAAGALLLPFALGSLACVSKALRAEDLSDAPLAFVYRTTSEEHERLKMLERNERTRLGVYAVRLQESLREGVTGDVRFEGHLHLLAPRTGKYKSARFALEGAVPLAWDPSHEHLLFRSGERGNTRIIREWTRETGVVRPTLPGRPGAQVDACYGPAGWKALSIQEGDGGQIKRRIYVLSPDGAVDAVSQGPWDGGVTCNPNSDALVFVRTSSSGQSQIFRLSWKSIQAGTLPEGRLMVSGADPAFSADGTLLVFVRKSGGRWQIWRMRDDGSGKVAVGRGVGDERSPSVSPDGGYVAYSTTANKRTAIRVRRMDGSGDRPLLLEGVGERPVW